VQSDSIDRRTFVLNVEDVSKIYDSAAGKIVALSNINFTIKKREFVSIVEPSVRTSITHMGLSTL
jgi:putative ABC transport system ATP-binding protein